MSIRNSDNFNDSKQYILEQLFVLDYNDDNDFNNLKMKLWVLDGPIRNEELIDGETPDTDVDNPMNHWETLLNDLVYLDLYIRTREDDLDDKEKPFDTFWDKRIRGKEKFVEKVKDEETGETYEDWEQPYNQRPTLLSKDDFSELYDAFIIKRSNGELEKVEDIVKKVTDYCIDIEAKQAERAVEDNVPPAEMEENLQGNSEKNAGKNDINYVNEMVDIHEELMTILSSIGADEPEEWELNESYSTNVMVLSGADTYSCIQSHTSTEDDEPGTGVNWEDYWILVEESLNFLGNIPEKRHQVRLSASSATEWYKTGDDNHRGIIAAGGGIKYKYRDSDGNVVNVPIGFNIGDPNTSFSSDLSPDRSGSIEKDWNDVSWCTYTETNEEGILTGKVSVVSDKEDLPSGGSEPGDLTRERFDILNERWININNLREFQIADMGTRAIIESMLNANIPDLLDDKVKHLDDKKDQKSNYTNILVEKREEFL